MKYASSVTLTDGTELLKDDLLEYLNGQGYVTDVREYTEPVKIIIDFFFEPFSDEPNDLWTMCLRAHEIEMELHSRGIFDWKPTREAIIPDPPTRDAAISKQGKTQTEEFIQSTAERRFERGPSGNAKGKPNATRELVQPCGCGEK